MASVLLIGPLVNNVFFFLFYYTLHWRESSGALVSVTCLCRRPIHVALGFISHIRAIKLLVKETVHLKIKNVIIY